jgi:methylmalonyl-CoA decarboxylase
MSLIVTAMQDNIGFVTLDNPQKRNALTESLVQEFIAALAQFKASRVRVVILRAQPGAAVWSAGHDVAELPQTERDPLGWDDPLCRLVREIEAFEAPVIAMIEGTVWGGACEVAFACDLTVASPPTTFPLTPAKLGAPYNIAGGHALNAATLRIKEMAPPRSRSRRRGRSNSVGEWVPIPSRRSRWCWRGRCGECAIEHRGDEGATAHSRRRAPMSPQGFERVQAAPRRMTARDPEGIRAFGRSASRCSRGNRLSQGLSAHDDIHSGARVRCPSRVRAEKLATYPTPRQSPHWRRRRRALPEDGFTVAVAVVDRSGQPLAVPRQPGRR